MKELIIVSKFFAVFCVGLLIGHLVSEPEASQQGGAEAVVKLSRRVTSERRVERAHIDSLRRSILTGNGDEEQLLALRSGDFSAILSDYFELPFLMGSDRTVCEKLMSTWAGSDPAGFFTWWKSEGFPMLEVGFGPQLILAMAGTDPEMALESIEELPEEAVSARSKAFQKVVFKLLPHQLGKGLKLANQLDGGVGSCTHLMIGQFLKEVPNQVLDEILKTESNKDKNALLLHHVNIIHEVLPGEIERLIEDPLVSQNVRTSLAMELAKSVGKSDPRKGLDLLELIENPAYRNGTRWEIYKGWASQDPRGAMDWAKGLPSGPEKWTALNHAGISRIKEDPGTIAEIFDELPSASLQRTLAIELVHQLDPSAYGDNSALLKKIDDAKLRREAEVQLFSRYAASDPGSAIHQAASNFDDFLADGRIEEAYRVLPNDSQEAFQLITSLPEESQGAFARAWLDRNGRPQEGNRNGSGENWVDLMNK